MMKHKILCRVKNVMYAFAVVCLLAQCSPEEDILPETQISEETTDEITSTSISSLTITGENTIIAEEDLDCKTCTYVVMKNTETIDAKSLGLKEGSIICLDKALTYGNVEFTNLIGTTEKPIIIGKTSFPSSVN